MALPQTERGWKEAERGLIDYLNRTTEEQMIEDFKRIFHGLNLVVDPALAPGDCYIDLRMKATCNAPSYGACRPFAFDPIRQDMHIKIRYDDD